MARQSWVSVGRHLAIDAHRDRLLDYPKEHQGVVAAAGGAEVSTIQELFPHCIIHDDRIEWRGGFDENRNWSPVHNPLNVPEPYIDYVRGYDAVFIDGEISIEQMKALIEWIGEPK